MTAIFTGLGSGLAKSSATTLGASGTLGGSATGRGREGLSVNAATGNLVISRRDEFLTGRGHDIGISRTYNSLAEVSDRDNGDQWQLSSTRRVFDRTGAVNTAGSTIKRQSGDGSVVTYAYGTRNGVSAYWTTDGSGSHDKIEWTGSQYKWTDGDTQSVETYGASPHNSGEYRLGVLEDRDGNAVYYDYVDGTDLVSRVKTWSSAAGGSWEQVKYNWSGNQLTSIQSEFDDPKTGERRTEIGTYYAYDGSGRLATVTVDLSPEVAGTADGHAYTISYLYDSAGRVTRVTQTDGSRTDIQYDAVGRVTQLTEHVGDGDVRATRIGYGVNVTSVTAADGTITKLWYDNKGQLVQLLSPPVNTGGPAIVQQFEYDDDGNLIRTIETDAENGTVPQNLVKAAGWADGEAALRGDNLVDDSGWPQDRDGTLPAAGSVGAGQGFTLYSAAETEWAKTTGPYGQSIVSMKTGQTDTGDHGGGAHSSNFAVDKTQAYQFTIYVKADQLDKQRAYFGLGGGIVKDGHTGAVNNNPYFTYEWPSSSKGWEADKWVKIVGYVLPDGSVAEDYGSVGGVYDTETGEKLYGMRHFTWNGDNAAESTYLRFFNFYNTDRQGKFTHWYRPEVRQVHETGIMRGDTGLDIERDRALFEQPQTVGWRSVAWTTNDDEARWSAVDGPDGARQIGLETGQFDGGYDGGGSYTNNFTIDATKAYKFTQYVRKEDLTKHSLYFGLQSGVKNAVSGAENTNPYFMALPAASQQAIGLQEGKWYKVVGYVLPEGSANLAGNLYGGIYDAETGTKIYDTTNYRWSEDRSSDETFARFFTYYNESDHGWTTDWLAPEVVELNPNDVAADSANPFGVVYDEGGVQTHYTYDDRGNLIATVDALGNVTARAYNSANLLISETEYGTSEGVTQIGNVAPTDIGAWGGGGYTSEAAGEIDGRAAKIYTSSVGANWTGISYGFDPQAGDVITYEVSLQAVGDHTAQELGIYSNSSGWGLPANGDAKILSGPGELVSLGSTRWRVAGLSTTEATRVQITRTVTETVRHGVYNYVDLPGGYRDGSQLKIAGPDVTILRGAGQELTTRYAYDGEGHLRYSVSADGRVSEYDYSSLGWLVSQKDYINDKFTGSQAVITEAQLNSWRDGLSNKSLVEHTTHGYDARGNRTSTTRYGGANSAGAGTGASGYGHSRTYYVYDQEGRLLTRYNQGENGKEQFVYDGLGRLVSSSDAAGSVTSVYFDDANSSTVMQMASGLTRTMRYNKSGDLVSSVDSSVGTHGANLQATPTAWWRGDLNVAAGGTLNGKPAYTFTTNKVNPTAAHTANGAVVEAGETTRFRVTFTNNNGAEMYVGLWGNVDGYGNAESDDGAAIIIDGPGRLERVDGAQWKVLGASATVPTTIEIVRTWANAQSSAGVVGFYSSATPLGSSFTIADPSYTKTTTDASLSFTAETQNKYDRQGRLRVSHDQFDGRGPTYFVYDKAGRMVGEVAPGGWLTEYFYDSQSRIISTINYTNAVGSVMLSQLDNPDNSLEMSDIRLAAHGYDVRSFTIYDDSGRVVQRINGEGEVVNYTYDQSDRLISERLFIDKVAVPTSWYTNPPTNPVTVSGHAQDAVTRTFYDRDGNVRGMLDGEGYLSEYTYDAAGRRTVEIAFANKAGSSLWTSGTFDQLRTSAGISNTNNRYVRSVYDHQGQLRFTINSSNHVTAYEYNTAGKLLRTIERATPLPGGHSSWTFRGVYDVVASNSNDRITTNTYNAFGQLSSTTDALGLTTYFSYDNAGNLTKAVAGDRTTRNWYDARGNLRYSVDAEGYLSSYIYNTAGQITDQRRFDTKVTVSDSTTIQQVVTLAANAGTNYSRHISRYDTGGRLWSEFDAVGVETVYGYRANGQLGYTFTGEHGAHGTGAGGDTDRSTTFYYYDNAGRLTRQDDASGESEVSITRFEYDGPGRQTRVVYGSGATSTDARTTYDKRGLVLTETNGAGNVLRYEYNAFGEVTKAWDAKNILVTQNTYNKLGQLTRSTDALGNHTNYTYTRFGEIATVTDPRGAVTSFVYNKHGQVTSNTDAEGYVESYQYNTFGERTRVTNKLGGITTSAYDKLGRMVSEVLPGAAYNASGVASSTPITKTYTYDAHGNVITEVKAAGLPEAITTTYEYDRANRLIKETIPAAHGQTAFNTFTYDGRGNMTSSTDATGGRTVYYYDDLDRVTVEINPVGTYTAYLYDKVGNVTNIKVFATKVSVPGDGGAKSEAPASSGTYRETRFEYDDAYRMTKSVVASVTSYEFNGSSLVSNASNLETLYQYDANGNVVKTTDPGGNTTWAYYDALNRKIAQVDGENYLTKWLYDGAGNVTRYVRYAFKISGSPTLNLPASPSSTGSRVIEYTYDKMGNRLTEVLWNLKVHDGSGGQTNQSRVTVRYQYNGLGQVTRKTEAIGNVNVPGDNDVRYTYDTSGRLERETRANFVDYEGTTISPIVDYRYDGLGNLARTVQYGNGPTPHRVTTYTYDNGLLRTVRDAEYNNGNAIGGKYQYYWYDKAGRVTVDYHHTRLDAYGIATTDQDGTPITNDGTFYTYFGDGQLASEVRRVVKNGAWQDFGPKTNYTYNAFGEVATVRVGNGLTQTNKYDQAGRLWASNAGDGVWKFFGYDKNGNQTIAINSAGANFTASTSFQSAFNQIGNANVNATYTQYDSRNLATKVVEEGRELTATGAAQHLTTQRAYNAFGEVAYEIDARDARIDYTYNNMGRVIKIENPTVSVQQENANGTLAAVTNMRPTEHLYYDASGRLVANRDANGNLTRMEYLNGTGFDGSEGLVTKTTYADGGIKETKYDRHGDARILIDQEGRRIEQTFDRMGRVTQVYDVGTGLRDYYTYDVNGQQLTHWNNQYGSGNKEITDYDALGRVTSSRAFGGDTTTTQYDWYDHIGGIGGWETITTHVGTPNSITNEDIFGRLRWKRDQGGHTYSYYYDVAGRLSSMSGNGVNQTYVYHNTGKLESVANVSGTLNTANFQELKTTYGYDAGGNLISQKTTDRGSASYNFYWNQYEPDVYTSTWNRTTQNQTATYDNLGRMISWNEAGGTDLPAASMTWRYDANGNIRRANATYRSILSDQSTSTINSTQDNWYRYDSMNRVVTSQGVLANNRVVRSTQGRDILYNRAGQRTRVLSNVSTSQRVYIRTFGGGGGGGGGDPTGPTYPFNANVPGLTGGGAATSPALDGSPNEAALPSFGSGFPQSEPGITSPFDSGLTLDTYSQNGYWETVNYTYAVVEEYVYDAGGRLDEVKSAQGYFDSIDYAEIKSHGHQVNAQDFVYGPGATVKRGEFVYDKMGRVTNQYDFAANGTTKVFDRAVVYNTDGTVQRETTVTTKGSDSYRSVANNYYNADNTLNYVLTTNTKNGSNSGAPNTRTDNTYVYFDGAVQSQVTYDENTGSSSNTIFRSTYTYDGVGVLQSAQINDGRARSVTYINNAEGQVISRKEKDNNHSAGDPSQIYYRFGGKEIGRVGNDGTSNVNYERTIAERTANTSSATGAFRNNAATGVGYADFGGDYDAINSYAQGSGGGSYTVRGGENLQAIAAQLWGDSALWYKIAEANGLRGSETLIEGQRLTIPTGVTRVHNNSGTIKPYDPAEAIGDTSPTTAAQPKKKKCGVFGAILLAVVAIAVTAATAGLGPVGAAIAGNLASQGVGLATGIQEKFNFKSLAITAVSAGVARGLGSSGLFGSVGDNGFTAGSLGIKSQLVDTVVRSSVSSALTQGVATATGLQSKFSIAGVAAAGIAAGVGQALGGGFENLEKNASFKNIAQHTAVGAASLFASAATRSSIEGSSFGRNIIVGLPDVIGQTLGRVLGKAIYDPARAAKRQIETNPVSEGGVPPIGIGLGGGLTVFAAGAPGVAAGQSVPDAAVTFVGPSETPEQALQRARAWEALRNDPEYAEHVETNALFFRREAARLARADAGPIAILAADTGSLISDLGSSLQEGLASVSDFALSGIANFREEYAVDSENYIASNPYDYRAYVVDGLVGFGTTAASAVSSIPGVIAHPVDRGLLPIAAGLDRVFLDNRSAKQVYADTRANLANTSGTRLAIGTGDVTFGVATAFTPARHLGLARTGRYASPRVDAYVKRVEQLRINVAAGKNGERLVPGIGEKQLFSVPGTNRYRIVDGFLKRESKISEVKNVQYQTLTQQLKDNIAISRSQGLRFDLYTRSDTILSKPLNNAILRGEITHKIIKGT
ncbi:putative toxin [Erythrobacter sp. W53]|uniref:putative toxin n=1 Tax=Erythrobacter sp. W53 TaxID=3425947 RepID=UPI003D767ED6